MKVIEKMLIDYVQALSPEDRCRLYKECEQCCETGQKDSLDAFFRALPPPTQSLLKEWGTAFFMEYNKSLYME